VGIRDGLDESGKSRPPPGFDPRWKGNIQQKGWKEETNKGLYAQNINTGFKETM
jgi:hypothetical protein